MATYLRFFYKSDGEGYDKRLKMEVYNTSETALSAVQEEGGYIVKAVDFREATITNKG